MRTRTRFRHSASTGAIERLVPVAVGVAVVAVLAGAAAFVGRSSLADAQSQRLTERTRYVDQVAKYEDSASGAAPMAAKVQATPFSQTDRSLDALLVSEFRTTSQGDPVAVTALLDRAGVPLLTSPAGSPVSTSTFGPAWLAAVAGKTSVTTVFTLQGSTARALLAPVGGTRPWGVLVEIVRSATSTGQAFDSGIGALDGRPGGLSLLDHDGAAFEGWNRGANGQRLLPAATVAGLPLLQVRHWTQQTPHGPVVWIAERLRQDYTLVFQQTAADLYGDLRQEQAHRDTILLLLLVVTVTGLLLSHFLRERSSRRARARLAALLANAQDLLLVVDAGGGLSFVSPSSRPLLGIDADSWNGTRFLDAVHPDDVDRVAAYLAAPADGAGLLNVRLIGAGGAPFWFDLDASDRSDLPEIGGTLITCHDAGQRKQLQDELHRQARHDALTGLANRAVLAERMDALLDQPASVVAVIYVDLDDFKPVNDTLGHDVGDHVLTVAANRLAELVPDDGLVARLGGDEFAMLLPGCDEETARGIAARAIWAVREPVVTPVGSARVDASVGIAVGYVGETAGIDAADPTLQDLSVVHPEALLRGADQAMYAAKGAGKGSYAVRWCHGPKVEPTGAFAPTRGAVERSLLPMAPPPSAPQRTSTRQWDSRRQQLQRQIRDLAAITAAVAIVVSLAAVDVSQETTARHHAEAARRAERTALTVEVADYAAHVIDPQQLVEPVSAAPWDLSDPQLDSGLAQAVISTAAGGPGSYAVLADRTGSVIASAGAVSTLPVAVADPAWALALAGRPSIAGLVGSPPDVYLAYTIPISRNGQVIAILEVAQYLPLGSPEGLLKATGSLGMGAGGLSVVDARGAAVASYDPNLVGQPLVSPTELTARGADATRLVTGNDGSVTITSPLVSIRDPQQLYAVFSQPASAFYGDIRVGQVIRDASLLLLLAVAVGGLAVAHRRRETTTRAEQARLDALLEHAHDVVVVLDATGSPTFVSSASRALLGRAPDDLLGTPLVQLLARAEDQDRFLAWLSTATSEAGQRASLHDIRLLDSAGRERWFDIESSDLRASTEVGGLLLTCHDSGARKQLQDQLTFQARHDRLTGLAHRGVFTADLERLGKTPASPPFAVLFIDLDHFKPVNDAFGHAAGDIVLSTVARRLQEQAQAGERVYRLGGDEFAVIVTDADREHAGRAADRVLLAIRQPLDLGDHTAHIDATIGVALSQSGDDGTTVVRQADQAMYQAKQSGRGRYTIAED